MMETTFPPISLKIWMEISIDRQTPSGAAWTARPRGAKISFAFAPRKDDFSRL